MPGIQHAQHRHNLCRLRESESWNSKLCFQKDRGILKMFQQFRAEGKNPAKAKVQSGQKWYVRRVSTYPWMTLNPNAHISTNIQLQTYPSMSISPFMLWSVNINVSAGRSWLKSLNSISQKWQPISWLILSPVATNVLRTDVTVETTIHVYWLRTIHVIYIERGTAQTSLLSLLSNQNCRGQGQRSEGSITSPPLFHHSADFRTCVWSRKESAPLQ